MPELSHHILIVEDDPQAADSMSELLLLELSEVLESVDHAASFHEAAQRVGTGHHDLYIVDHVLGDGTGIQLLHLLRERGVTSPCIYVTAREDAAIVVEAMKAGASEYFVKGSFSPELLVLTVRKSLAQRRRDQEYLRSRHALKDVEALRVQALVLERMMEGVGVCSDSGVILYTNPAEDRMYGYDTGELIGKPALDLTFAPSEDAHESDGEIGAVLHAGNIWTGELLCHRKNGSTFTTSTYIMPLEMGELRRWVWVQEDITQRKELEREIARRQRELEEANARLRLLSVTDELTGLQNRRGFQQHLEREVSRSLRHHHPISLLLIDLDHFKNYNDSFGHPAGDRLLAAIAGTLRSNARDSDVVARYGGEEFAIILPDTTRDGAASLGERFRLAVERTAEGTVTASVGATTIVPSLGNLTTASAGILIRDADMALYRSKERGRNCVTHAADGR